MNGAAGRNILLQRGRAEENLASLGGLASTGVGLE